MDSVQLAENKEDWFDDSEPIEPGSFVTEYDISVSPNDFNISTLFNFIESGAIIIDHFQRHFVWDRPRSSKLIESLILGLPVPQLFLYERSRNKFLVIDGQQRLLSIYYFLKEKFPRKEKRAEIRSIFDEHGTVPEEILNNSEYFQTFRLSFPSLDSNDSNKLQGFTYSDLGDLKTQLDLRPIRNIIIKQNSPDNHDSVYEIFTRLNTGGMNLNQQEIRASIYDSEFYKMLYRMNQYAGWRRILRKPEPDLRLKDIEILLRGFGMLVDGENYKPSMVKFLNSFSRKSKSFDSDHNHYIDSLFKSFLSACENLPDDTFVNKSNYRFNIALYEAVFTTACQDCYSSRKVANSLLNLHQVQELENDTEFKHASQYHTTGANNVKLRLEKAQELIDALTA